MADAQNPNLQDAVEEDANTSAENERSLTVRANHQSENTRSWLRYPFLAAGIALFLGPFSFFWPREGPIDPTDYVERTKRVLKTTPYDTTSRHLVLANSRPG
jgi:membrane dipeptidase